MDLIDDKSSLLLNGSPSKKDNSLLITLSFVLVLPTITILLTYFSSPLEIKKFISTRFSFFLIEDLSLTKLYPRFTKYLFKYFLLSSKALES